MASSVRRRLGCITPAFQLGDFDLDFVFKDFSHLFLSFSLVVLFLRGRKRRTSGKGILDSGGVAVAHGAGIAMAGDSTSSPGLDVGAGLDGLDVGARLDVGPPDGNRELAG